MKNILKLTFKMFSEAIKLAQKVELKKMENYKLKKPEKVVKPYIKMVKKNYKV